MIAAALPQPSVDSGAAEMVLLVAGIAFTLVIIGVFGAVIVGALRAERRAEEERRRLRERFAQRQGEFADDRASEGVPQDDRPPEGPTR